MLHQLLLTAALFAAPPAPDVSTVVQWRSGLTPSALSSDGTLLLTWNEDGATLWDVQTARELRSFGGFKSKPLTVRFSPDDQLVIVADGGQLLRFYDTVTGRLVHSQDTGAGRNEISFSQDGRLFAIPIKGGGAVYELATFTQVHQTEGRPVFARDGTLWVLPKYDWYDTKRYELETWRELSVAPKREKGLRKRQGDRVLRGTGEGGVVLLDAAGTELSRVDGALADFGRVMSWDADLEREILAVLRYGGEILGGAVRVELFDLGTGARTGILDLAAAGGESPASWACSLGDCVQFTPDGRHILVGHQLFDLETRQRVRSYESAAHAVHFAGFLEGGRKIVTVTTPRTVGVKWTDRAHQIRIWDLASLRVERVIDDDGGMYIARPALAAKTSRLLVTPLVYPSPEAQRPRASVRIWDLAKGAVRTAPTRPETWDLDTSADGRLGVVFVYDNPHFEVTVRELKRGKVRKRIKKRFHDNNGKAVAFSPDGRRVAYAGREAALHLWDLRTGKVRKAVAGFRQGNVDTLVQELAFSPDGKLLAVATGHQVQLWDPRKLKKLRTLNVVSAHRAAGALAFSPDSRRLLTGDADRRLKLWEVATGELLHSAQGHSQPFEYHHGSVTFSPDGRFVLSAADATVRLWRAEDLSPVVTLVSVGDDDAIALTPDGYYTGTRGALPAVHFTAGLQTLPLESFDLRFNRPDIVLERVGLTTRARIHTLRRAWEKRLALMGFTSEQVEGDLALPRIERVSSTPLQSGSRELAFTVRAVDDSHALSRLNVYVNGVPERGRQGLPVSAGPGQALEQQVQVELGEGTNHIEVSVHNAQGVESLRWPLQVRYTGAAREKTLHLLAVGISDYPGEEYDLTYAAKDARDLSQAFRDAAGGEAVVQVLSDAAATTAGIGAAGARLRESQVDDTVVMFVAGHGLLDDRLDYYFATHDVDFANPAASGMPYDALEGLLDGIPARHKVFLMDTCFSGEVDREGVERTSRRTGAGTVKVRAVGSRGLVPRAGLPATLDLVRELFGDLRRGSGAVVISAAGGAEFALESDQWSNGVFTYSVLQGLREADADADQDGKILVSELRDFVISQVSTLTAGRQKPTMRRENLVQDFVLKE